MINSNAIRICNKIKSIRIVLSNGIIFLLFAKFDLRFTTTALSKQVYGCSLRYTLNIGPFFPVEMKSLEQNKCQNNDCCVNVELASARTYAHIQVYHMNVWDECV